jgi:hypothetical protein
MRMALVEIPEAVRFYGAAGTVTWAGAAWPPGATARAETSSVSAQSDTILLISVPSCKVHLVGRKWTGLVRPHFRGRAIASAVWRKVETSIVEVMVSPAETVFEVDICSAVPKTFHPCVDETIWMIRPRSRSKCTPGLTNEDAETHLLYRAHVLSRNWSEATSIWLRRRPAR